MPKSKVNLPPEESTENASPASVLRASLVSGVIISDRAGKITTFSPAAEAFLSVSASAALGQSIAILPATLQKIIQQVLADGRPVTSRPINLPDAPHGPLLASVQALPVHTGGAEMSGVIVVLNDLTSVQKIQQNIVRLDRLANLGTLSASLAHEIKNALVAVRTFVDLLLEQNRDAELAEVVGRELKRIDVLVSQMLRVASPAKTRVTTVRVHDLIEHSVRLVQHQLDEKMISLRRALTAPADAVSGNGDQLEQAFMNLLLNALEAMGPNGELTVSTETLPPSAPHPARLAITFRDTGIGIPPENLARLFETFFTTKKNGTGLGLAITRRIIHEHHGEITVESLPNQGATFCLTLPLV